MRYIEKKECPDIIKEWIRLRNSANQSLSYSDFDHIKKLNDILREEQKHICCYCQQIITHHNKPFKGGSHNEHFIPQKGANGNSSLEMEYTNIFASCNYSKGSGKRHQHCGEAKDDKIIRNFLADKDCASYFKYNIFGEILPAGDYVRYEEYLENENELSELQKEVLRAIKVLNLNCSYLVEERKKVSYSLMKVINKIPKEKIKTKIVEFNNADRFYRFIDMLLFFMRKKVG